MRVVPLVSSDNVWFMPSGSRIIRPDNSDVVKKGNPAEAIIDYDGICVSYDKWSELQKK